MPHFIRKSIDRLNSCDPRLQLICHEAIKIYDFTVIEGYRDKERQTLYYNEGKSKTKYPNSKHNKKPSQAVDIAPYNPIIRGIDWNDKESFHLLAGIMFGVAHSHDIALRWGGDWDGDWNLRDQTFYDLPHFELIN